MRLREVEEISLTGKEDKIYIVMDGVLKQVEIPPYGNLEFLIVDNQIVNIDSKTKYKIPGRKKKV